MVRRYKCLVDQKTGLVIWMSEFLLRRPPAPSADPEYLITFTDKEIWPAYNKYRLYYNVTDGFQNKEPEQGVIQNKENIRLTRAKASAIDQLKAMVDYNYDRHDIMQRDFFKMVYENLDERWISYIQDEYNLTTDNAIKFIMFKMEEIKSIEYNLESLQHSLVNKIKKSTSINETFEIFKQAMIHLWVVKKYEVEELAPEFRV